MVDGWCMFWGRYGWWIDGSRVRIDRYVEFEVWFS